jgi:uncharacterized protein (TIGR04255 family)
MPVAFRKSPLLEAIFELRFEAAVPTAGDLLPGLLYRELRDEYPEVQPLPMATVPREIRAKDPNLLYQSTHRLAGRSGIVQVGDRALAIAFTAPYPGWARFKDAVVRLLRTADGTRIIAAPERFSFRYVNIVPAEPGQPQLAFLNLKIDSGYEFVERGFHLRFEHGEGPLVIIVQVSPQATAKAPDGSGVAGLLIDIDTVFAQPRKSFWEDGADLEAAHLAAKRAFFSLIAQSTLERLQPIYE